MPSTRPAYAQHASSTRPAHTQPQRRVGIPAQGTVGPGVQAVRSSSTEPSFCDACMLVLDLARSLAGGDLPVWFVSQTGDLLDARFAKAAFKLLQDVCTRSVVYAELPGTSEASALSAAPFLSIVYRLFEQFYARKEEVRQRRAGAVCGFSPVGLTAARLARVAVEVITHARCFHGASPLDLISVPGYA
jgi:hypothetical protein